MTSLLIRISHGNASASFVGDKAWIKVASVIVHECSSDRTKVSMTRGIIQQEIVLNPESYRA